MQMQKKIQMQKQITISSYMPLEFLLTTQSPFKEAFILVCVILPTENN